MKVSALFVRQDSIYKQLGVDCWDIDRDARNWPGGNPLIAHPPCRAWGRFRAFANPRPDEKQLAITAIDLIRKWGGVLEHPAASSLWKCVGLPLPGENADQWGGWSLSVDQFWFGHKARKRTWLYIVGVSPGKIPAYPLKMDAIEYVVNGDKGTRWKKEITRKEREHTPPAFAEFLIELCEKIA